MTFFLIYLSGFIISYYMFSRLDIEEGKLTFSRNHTTWKDVINSFLYSLPSYIMVVIIIIIILYEIIKYNNKTPPKWL